MDLVDSLKKAGLRKPEVVLYLYLLENGASSPPQMTKGTGLLRANIYHVLRSLEEKRLVGRNLRGKRYLYAANDPASIVSNLESRKEAIIQALPDLRALYRSEKNKPTIKFHYGLEEVRQIFSRLEKAEEILFIMPTDFLFERYPKFFKQIREEMAARKIFVRDILTQASGVEISRKTRDAMRGYYDFRLFAQKYEDMPIGIRIWNDNVALVTFDEPVFGTVLTQPSLAKTFRVMFENMWQHGERFASPGYL